MMKKEIGKTKFPKDDNHNTCFLKETPEIRSWKYDILHELAHAICGESCCREHCEFEAHGGAKILCFLLGIDIGDAEERMSCYAGRSSRKACGRYNFKKTKKDFKKNH